MQTDMLHEVWFWFSPLLFLILPAVHYVRRWYTSHNSSRLSGSSVTVPSVPGSKLLKVDQDEPANKPPVILSIGLVVCALFLLAFGALGLYLWATGKIVARIDISTVLFIIIFVAVPVFVLVDTLFLDPRFYRLGRSFVERHKEIIFDGDIGTAFKCSRRALAEMNAAIIKMEKPKLLRTRLGKFIMTVKLKRRKGNKSAIHVSSDAQWLTVKFGAGVNQKNIDTFQSKLDRLGDQDSKS